MDEAEIIASGQTYGLIDQNGYIQNSTENEDQDNGQEPVFDKDKT